MDNFRYYANGWGAQSDPNKWNLPGWRIEQRYQNGTLVGNWKEDRLNFTRKTHKHSSTHRLDFPSYDGRKPDTWNRRRNTINMEGLSETQLTRHHGDRWDGHQNITTYDERYNKRIREMKRNQLPPLRRLNLRKEIGWKPEQSDHPLEGKPTNWGLYQQKQQQWNEGDEGWKDIFQKSVYSSVYQPYTTDQFPTRHGITPKSLSSQIHPITATNKNLNFRGLSSRIAPERPPSLLKPNEGYPYSAPSSGIMTSQPSTEMMTS